MLRDRESSSRAHLKLAFREIFVSFHYFLICLSFSLSQTRRYIVETLFLSLLAVTRDEKKKRLATLETKSKKTSRLRTGRPLSHSRVKRRENRASSVRDASLHLFLPQIISSSRLTLYSLETTLFVIPLARAHSSRSNAHSECQIFSLPFSFFQFFLTQKVTFIWEIGENADKRDPSIDTRSIGSHVSLSYSFHFSLFIITFDRCTCLLPSLDGSIDAIARSTRSRRRCVCVCVSIQNFNSRWSHASLVVQARQKNSRVIFTLFARNSHIVSHTQLREISHTFVGATYSSPREKVTQHEGTFTW